MTYVYRRTEDIEREPTAPYIFREAERGPRKRPRRKDYNPDLCGTTKGYWQHRRYDEPQCPGCSAAYSDYLRGYRERNPEKGGRKHGLVQRGRQDALSPEVTGRGA
jgi:hypothetical protein